MLIVDPIQARNTRFTKSVTITRNGTWVEENLHIGNVPIPGIMKGFDGDDVSRLGDAELIARSSSTEIESDQFPMFRV